MNSIAAIAATPTGLLAGAAGSFQASGAAPRFFNLISVTLIPAIPDSTPSQMNGALIRQLLGQAVANAAGASDLKSVLPEIPSTDTQAKDTQSKFAPVKSLEPRRARTKDSPLSAAAQCAAALAQAPTAPVEIPQIQVPISVSPGPDASGEDRPSSPDPAGSAAVAAVLQQKPEPPQTPLAFAARLTPAAAAPVITQNQPGPKLIQQITAQATPVAPEQKQLEAQQIAIPGKAADQDQHAQAPDNAAASVAALPRAADFNFTQQRPVTQPQRESTGGATAFGQVAQTLRASESISTATSTSGAAPVLVPQQPLQHIAVRVTAPNVAPVDLQVRGHAGEIHVAVHTADAALETSLRQDLGTLGNSLEHAGYRTEMFVPAPAAVHSAASSQMNASDDHQDPSGSSGQGSPGDLSQGRQQQHNRDRRRHAWLDEMENLI